MSPFITERAIAGSPENIKATVDRFADTVVNQLNYNRDRVGEVGGSVASMFLKRFEASLGGDKKSPFFENIIDDLRERIPELDQLAQSAVDLLKARAAQYGVVTEGIGLRSEQSMRSIIDNLRKEVGISDKIWKGFSASTRAALNEDFMRAALDYISILEEMSLEARTSALDQTVAIKELFAEWRKGLLTTEEFMARLSGRTADFTIKAISDIDALGKSVKGLSERVSEAMGRIRGVMEETTPFQTQELFGGVLSQIEDLAARSGIAVDKLQEQFRVQLVEAMRAGKAGAQEALAALDASILNSNLTRLEQVWGQPVGRAIQAILVHFGKLESGLVQKISSIGSLLSSLPDALGGRTLNKWIDTVNQWINFGVKLANVLKDVFKIDFPKPIQDILNTLNNGAQLTTQIMQDMSAQIQTILKGMAAEVVKIMNSLVSGVKAEIDKLKQTGQTARTNSQTILWAGSAGYRPGSAGYSIKLPASSQIGAALSAELFKASCKPSACSEPKCR